MDHKAWCSCKRCQEARDIERAGKPKRVLPQGILLGFQEKKAKEENEMLIKGMILMSCPSCKHTTYMKIGPVMKCGCCMYEIK
jgi:hypothetical protein